MPGAGGAFFPQGFVFFFSKLPEGKNALDRHPGGGVLLPDTVPLL
jgi:hypothetical protein